MDFLGNCSESLPRFLGTSLVETRIGDLCRSIEGTRFLQLSLGILIPMFPMYLSVSNKAGTGHRLLHIESYPAHTTKTPRNSLPTVHTHCSGMFRSHLLHPWIYAPSTFFLRSAFGSLGACFSADITSTDHLKLQVKFRFQTCSLYLSAWWGTCNPRLTFASFKHNQFFFLANLWISLASPS